MEIAFGNENSFTVKFYCEAVKWPTNPVLITDLAELLHLSQFASMFCMILFYLVNLVGNLVL